MLEVCGVQVEGYIISDGQRKVDKNKKVYFLSEVCIDKENDMIVGAVALRLQEEIRMELERKGICEYFFADDSIHIL